MKTNTLFKGMAVLLTTGSPLTFIAQDVKPERPNFVWFMAEDISKHYLSLYNDGKYGATTPNVEKLANDGIIFNNAYGNAPVSSVARSTLITGCYAPRIGASFHRKLEEVPLPEGLSMFPAYLREAGYHTSNASKTDYNLIIDENAWNIVNGKIGAWRNREDKNAPFFHVRTNAISHESSLHFNKSALKKVRTKNNPKDVYIHPYHPDTELFRYTYATFYDRIEDGDKELGELINMLEEDDELKNTFIFYFGDNGGSLPGTKGYTTEPGLQVPLIVYVPEEWRDRLPIETETIADGFVSFMDFGPTLLHLAGVNLPDEMDGTPFLGEDISLKQLNARDEVYGYADRFDELYSFNRTVRKGDFKYSRNFQPYHPKSLHSFYRYKQEAFLEWHEMYKEGKLNAIQSRFFEPQGAEELYDLSIDPYETVNLANDQSYNSKLKELRSLLKSYMLDKNDLGFFPECVWLEKGKQNPTEFGRNNSSSIKKYSDIADLQMTSFKRSKTAISNALNSSDPVERYWGATVCATFGKEAHVLSYKLKKLLNDPEAFVRSRAIVALSRIEKINPVVPMKKALLIAKAGAESLLILNDITYLQDAGFGYHFDLDKINIAQIATGVDRRLEYLNEE